MLLLVASLAFISGALLALGLATPTRKSMVAERLDHIAGRATGAVLPLPERDAPRANHLLRKMLAAIGGRVAARGATRTRLERAGNPAGLGAGEYTGLRVLSIALFLVPIPLAAPVLGTSVPMKVMVVTFILIIGLSLPEAWLQGKTRERQTKIRKSLPDTLDLLVVSVEAGVGFDGAVAQVVTKQAGPLAQELRRALQEMRLGRTRAEALKDLAARVDVPEVASFVAAITQAERLGSGVADVLRVQSEAARTQRMQRAREAAAKLPTKMLFPLVLFLFPALFVVLLGPGLINLLRVLGPH